VFTKRASETCIDRGSNGLNADKIIYGIMRDSIKATG
jgi:hypothetical protein